MSHTCRIVLFFAFIILVSSTDQDEIYNWQTGAWGVCWSDNSCGTGTEERTVWCGDSLGRPVPAHLCDRDQRPNHSRPCYAACKGQWKVGVWSACEQNSKVTKNKDGLCPGIRQRNITCISSSRDDRTPICPDPSPPTKVSCYTLCPQNCAVGPWSHWTPCISCQDNSYRTRQVIIAPAHHGKVCPELSESRRCLHNCSENSIPEMAEDFLEISYVRETYKVRVGQWGACIRADKSEKKKTKNDNISSMISSSPEVGIQYRNVTCINEKGDNIHSEKCLEHISKLLQKRSCVIPVDCEITEWSSWKVNRKGCVAPNGQVVRELRERRRSALSLQHGDGQPCPHLIEKHTVPETNVQPCNTRHQWLASAWGPCLSTVGPEPESEVLCGGGVQKRQIICVRSDDQVPVSDDNCQYVEPPPRYQRCEVGCERDCSLGFWSEWGICTSSQCGNSNSKDSQGFQIRRRGINVVPSVLGKECDALEQQIKCHQPKCHQWIYGEWTSCILGNQTDKCGRGKMMRNSSCSDESGVSQKKHHCIKELGLSSNEKECHVPCPFDCVLSEWSDWTPCSRPCSYKNHIGSTQRNASIISPAGKGGRECPAPDELTEVKTCRTESCSGTFWKPDSWATCRVNNEDSICGEGTQQRAIVCYSSLERKILPDASCSGLYKPPEKRQCDVPCSSQCSLSKWSEWSECLTPKPCPTSSHIVRSVQKRWRRVLQHSLVDKSCEDLVQERPCALISGSCLPATWTPGQWSDCILPEGVTCGGGYRVRDLPCVNGSAEVVEPMHCLLGSTVVPDNSEKCFVFCNTSCAVSSWSKWSSCPINAPCSDAYSRRTRQLLSTNNIKGENCQGIPLEESQKCPCQLFYSEPASNWSDCIITNNNKATHSKLEMQDDSPPRFQAMTQLLDDISSTKRNNTKNFCGVGTKYRSLKCIREDGTAADPSYCDHSGLETEPCIKECPVDCLVHPWGEWSKCNSSCGAGIQERHRKIVQESLWGGRECPMVIQNRACWGQCNFYWLEEGWTECQMDTEAECGNGTQYRTVRCVEDAESGLQVTVDSQLCDPLTKPPTHRKCTLYCPGQCVVSEWSIWSLCSPDCNESLERFRTRTITRHPSPKIKDCPSLMEKQRCIEHISCWKHSWRTGNWTSCVPLGHSSCGEGVRNRIISCTRSDGRVVGDQHCAKESRPTPQEKWCYVDCPVDCQTSAWSEWDKSKCSCGDKGGHMKRSRFIMVNPSDSGRTCPEKLEEFLPCGYSPCFNWERGPWSQCELQGGDCGHGSMERRVRCRGPGGIIVNDDKCLNLIHIGGHTWPSLAHALDLNTLDGCYVPCDGDCEMTEWTGWSQCHRDCAKGQQGGVQTRSRAILSSGSSTKCPGNLWESRPCISGPCLTFTWQIIHGTVTCVRSDGLVVTGGCGDAPRPCLPACTVVGSFCSPVGICVCKRGLRPHYSEAMRYRLTKCVPLVNLTLSKASALSQPKYLPENINGWMFAMVGVGSAFVVFVIISVYVMCKSPKEALGIPLSHRHQPSYPERSAHTN